MVERVLRTIERYRMLPSGTRVGVAVSGGADSVCLLHVLLELGRWPLTVLHLNHGLRGEESRTDAEFVRDLAQRHGLPDRIEEAVMLAGNVEQAAREARLAFFRAAMGSGEVDRVATAHSRSDQAETVLFRFLRGSGTAGLAGIRPVTGDGIVRPLLEIERCDIVHYLVERGIDWREDSTNPSGRFARNRIRHTLLPQLARDWNPEIVRTLAHAADWALAEETYWRAELDRLAAAHLVERDGVVMMRAQELGEIPRAVARRLVRRAIEQVKGDLRAVDFNHVEQVLDLAGRAQGHGRSNLPGIRVIRSFGWLRFGSSSEERQDYSFRVQVPGIYRIPGTALSIDLELLEKPKTSDLSSCVYNGVMGCLDWHSLPGSLELRNWRAGDQYRPRESSGVEKLKTLFQKARIPVWERRYWPVLAAGSLIVWARRFGAAEQFAAGPASGWILRVRDAESG